MKKREQQVIDRLDPRYQPISAWGYLGYQILFAIPVIGWFFLIVFACSSSNLNRRSFARSYFCVLLIGLIFGGLAVLILWVSGVFPYIAEVWQGIIDSITGTFGK